MDDEIAILQVGPLARQKCYDTIPTEQASEMLNNFRQQYDRNTDEIYATHYCRIIETMYSLERTIEILKDPLLMKKDAHIRVSSSIKEASGVGIIEAPRGNLIHSYETNPDGRISKANLIVPTTFNNPAINLALLKVAKKKFDPNNFFVSKIIPDATLRQIESTVRIFDPCLTCSTHSYNNLNIEIKNIEGTVIYSIG
jgi:coenzyme F420-reducing hydrogenase alpha subunit